jgi:hypothetical protein
MAALPAANSIVPNNDWLNIGYFTLVSMKTKAASNVAPSPRSVAVTIRLSDDKVYRVIVVNMHVGPSAKLRLPAKSIFWPLPIAASSLIMRPERREYAYWYVNPENGVPSPPTWGILRA